MFNDSLDRKDLYDFNDGGVVATLDTSVKPNVEKECCILDSIDGFDLMKDEVVDLKISVNDLLLIENWIGSMPRNECVSHINEPNRDETIEALFTFYNNIRELSNKYSKDVFPNNDQYSGSIIY